MKAVVAELELSKHPEDFKGLENIKAQITTKSAKLVDLAQLIRVRVKKRLVKPNRSDTYYEIEEYDEINSLVKLRLLKD